MVKRVRIVTPPPARLSRSLPVFLLLLLTAGAWAQTEEDIPIGSFKVRLDFVGDRTGHAPFDLNLGREGGETDGRWEVQTSREAPTDSKVLVQADGSQEKSRFLFAVMEEPTYRDVELSVQCRAVAGELFQSAGLVARFQDSHNYYVARMDALDGDVRLYSVKDGKWKLIAYSQCDVKTGQWGRLGFRAEDDRFLVLWNDEIKIEIADDSSRYDGQAGVWTRADSVCQFDAFVAEPIR